MKNKRTWSILSIVLAFLLLNTILGYVILVASELEDFKSPEELKEWVRLDETNLEMGEALCGARVLKLIASAKKDGFNLHFDVLSAVEYNSVVDTFTHTKIIDGELKISKWPKLGEGEAHAVASAIIGNEIWYIEPLADVVWKLGIIN